MIGRPWIPCSPTTFRDFLPSDRPTAFGRLWPIYCLLAEALPPNDSALDTSYSAIAKLAGCNREKATKDVMELETYGFMSVTPRMAGKRPIGVHLEVFHPLCILNGAGVLVCKVLRPFVRTKVHSGHEALARHFEDRNAGRGGSPRDGWLVIWTNPNYGPGSVAKLIHEQLPAPKATAPTAA